MDTTVIKNALAKLSFIKSFSGYVLPTILTAVALLLFVPGKWLSYRLKADVQQESIRRGADEVGNLLSNFVPQNQWKVEKAYEDAYAEDANEIAAMALQTTKRELLSYKLFPQAKDTSVLIFREFGERFQAGVESLIKEFRGGRCPSEAEIEFALQGEAGGSGDFATPGLPGMPGTARRTRSTRDRDEVHRAIEDELCRAAAEAVSFYANPVGVAGYEFWAPAGSGEIGGMKQERYEYESPEQSVRTCWYWQLGYWIIEDVFQTIGAVNSDCDSVLNCPVKRLVSISFEQGSGSGPAGGQPKGVGTPHYVTSSEDGLTVSLTNRVSDETIDVVDFKMVVLVSSKAVLRFMEELCSAKQHKFSGYFGQQPVQIFKHNQITILEATTQPIVSDDVQHELYRYGDDAVVELVLICEYVFDKEGYKPINPLLTERQEDNEQR